MGDHEAIARLLLDSGADVDAADNDEYTPLHGAVWRGHKLAARLLVERGAPLLNSSSQALKKASRRRQRAIEDTLSSISIKAGPDFIEMPGELQKLIMETSESQKLLEQWSQA